MCGSQLHVRGQANGDARSSQQVLHLQHDGQAEALSAETRCGPCCSQLQSLQLLPVELGIDLSLSGLAPGTATCRTLPWRSSCPCRAFTTAFASALSLWRPFFDVGFGDMEHLGRCPFASSTDWPVTR